MYSLKNEILCSLQQRYAYEIQQAKATMLIYLNNPVGIGEHPQHLEEMDTLLEKMAAADDKLTILNRLFPIEQ